MQEQPEAEASPDPWHSGVVDPWAAALQEPAASCPDPQNSGSTDDEPSASRSESQRAPPPPGGSRIVVDSPQSSSSRTPENLPPADYVQYLALRIAGAILYARYVGEIFLPPIFFIMLGSSLSLSP